MITPEKRERAYERYELYRDAKSRWKIEKLKPFTILFLFWILGLICIFKIVGIGGIDLIMKYIFIGIPIVTLFGVLIPKGITHSNRQQSDSTLELTLQDLDAVKNVEGVHAKGNHIEFEVSREKADEIIERINAEAKEKGLHITIKKSEIQPSTENENAPIIEDENDQKMRSTETGYVNKNNQKNLGKTDEPGNGNYQWFYEMECLNCGHKYKANGHDIWLRKCPKCQGGKP